MDYSGFAPPIASNLDLLCDCQGIVHFDTKVSDSTLNFRVSEKELYGPQIARSSVDLGRLGSPKGMGPIEEGIETNARNPSCDQARILPGGEAAR